MGKYSTVAHGGPVSLRVNVEILFLLVTKIVMRKNGDPWEWEGGLIKSFEENMEGTNYYISLICRSMQGFGGENGVDWREREREGRE